MNIVLLKTAEAENGQLLKTLLRIYIKWGQETGQISREIVDDIDKLWAIITIWETRVQIK